jgi:hypothetical protein
LFNILYGFQRGLQGSIAIVETPQEQRNPINAQRFRRTLRGSEQTWQLKVDRQGFQRFNLSDQLNCRWVIQL